MKMERFFFFFALLTCSVTYGLQQQSNGAVFQKNLEISLLNVTTLNAEVLENILLENLVAQHSGKFLNCKDVYSQGYPSGYYIFSTSTGSGSWKYCAEGFTRVMLWNPAVTCGGGELKNMLIEDKTIPLCHFSEGSYQMTVSDYLYFDQQYEQLKGRVKAYSIGGIDSFYEYSHVEATIDERYVDGISITLGSSTRQHVFTYAISSSLSGQYGCPCFPEGSPAPPYVGDNYYCTYTETAIDQLLFNYPLCDLMESCCGAVDSRPEFSVTLPTYNHKTDPLEIRGLRSAFDEDIFLLEIELFAK
eukprot:GCRY01003080.1.p1 GENE.GCRY01003080.1~~GCRY01003080.1.p1  ORF type:complete len:303 (-),score=30.82 GCRY01003080.1:17-925(-)